MTIGKFYEAGINSSRYIIRFDGEDSDKFISRMWRVKGTEQWQTVCGLFDNIIKEVPGPTISINNSYSIY